MPFTRICRLLAFGTLTLGFRMVNAMGIAQPGAALGKGQVVHFGGVDVEALLRTFGFEQRGVGGNRDSFRGRT